MFDNVNRNKGQVLTEEQLKSIALQGFNMIDMRGTGALSKSELREFMEFIHESVLMHQTKFKFNSLSNVSESDFDDKAFEELYKKLPHVVITVKPGDKDRIKQKLGEDVFEGDCKDHPDGHRYEDRVDFDAIWDHLIDKFRKDGVLFRPFEVREVPAEEGAEENSPVKQKPTLPTTN